MQFARVNTDPGALPAGHPKIGLGATEKGCTCRVPPRTVHYRESHLFPPMDTSPRIRRSARPTPAARSSTCSNLRRSSPNSATRSTSGRANSRISPRWTKSAEDVRILRVPCGGREFIPKEYLYRDLLEWSENALRLIRRQGLTYEFINSHYWDAGVAGQRLSEALGVPHIHTPHSLGIVEAAPDGDRLSGQGGYVRDGVQFHRTHQARDDHLSLLRHGHRDDAADSSTCWSTTTASTATGCT